MQRAHRCDVDKEFLSCSGRPYDALRQQFIRILGRVVAHETGHYVLRSPGHAPSGLMRAVQTAAELGEMPTMRYRLSANDVRRLHHVLADEKKGPAQGRP